ncbi:Uma2 family endonuclease [Romeria aff. gracilis LEGE 07310]|uniref:Uma2 family endonuclease n=1 Tax=Vasconcelosia minhoensis LEGE 07310 TaxID=915328 RepID=A0A8J7AKJ0_9CYAN|nr:Uma2 family endonuclease [Romeria gracilis]MBE9075766.1 Uma2 family endonuclease [Romeria aff. gracilis LEGE 07310]
MSISLESSTQMPSVIQQGGATWQDYKIVRDSAEIDWHKIAFNQGWLWVDMGKEGPNHASFSDLMTIIFGFWAFLYPDVPLQSYGRCLIEKPETQACAPDLVLYKGENFPRWQPGEPRRISFPQHRLPDLVGEIADTSLSLDLDEQKQLYASLGIPEYWVIDVKGTRLFAFGLSPAGTYEPIQVSQALADLPIALIEQTLERLATETNTAAANWLMQQIQAQVSPGFPNDIEQ